MSKVFFVLMNKKREYSGIRAKVTLNGVLYTYPTGVSVEVSLFNKGRCRASLEAGSINIRLDAIEAAIKSTVVYFNRNFETPGQDLFRKKVDQFLVGDNNAIQIKRKEQDLLAYIDRYIDECGLSKDTTKCYKLCRNKLEEFHKGRMISFAEVDKKFAEKFRAWMIKKGWSRNYIGTIIKNLKKFMQLAYDEGLHTDLSFKKFQKEKEEADTIYLSLEELIILHRLELTDELLQEHYPDCWNSRGMKEALIRSKNTFLIGAMCAMRVSDYSRIRETDIRNDTITIMPKKGSSLRKPEPVTIPLHWIVKEILSGGFDLANTAPDYLINRHIKTLCKMAGMTEQISTYITRGGKLEESVNEKWELVSTHTARRSGATNMHLAGMPDELIMACTGHSSTAQLYQYIKANRIKKIEELRKCKYFQ